MVPFQKVFDLLQHKVIRVDLYFSWSEKEILICFQIPVHRLMNLLSGSLASLSIRGSETDVFLLGIAKYVTLQRTVEDIAGGSSESQFVGILLNTKI
jgi:hypothetical protein